MQVQRWLGHHAASFTLDTYVHLLEADLGEPLEPEKSKQTEESAAVLGTYQVGEPVLT